MKNLLKLSVIFTLVFGFISCNENNNSQKQNTKQNEKAVMVFEQMDHDFGTVTEGEKVIYSFKFTNTGKVDLHLTSVGTSCGCTASNYPHQAIKAGDTGQIQVTFNSANRLGMQHKKVTIRANTDPQFTVLNVYAKVIEKNSEN
jgi:hypothetical protein